MELSVICAFSCPLLVGSELSVPASSQQVKLHMHMPYQNKDHMVPHW